MVLYSAASINLFPPKLKKQLGMTRVITLSRYQGGLLLICSRLTERPALKRAYWFLFSEQMLVDLRL